MSNQELIAKLEVEFSNNVVQTLTINLSDNDIRKKSIEEVCWYVNNLLYDWIEKWEKYYGKEYGEAGWDFEECPDEYRDYLEMAHWL